MVALLALFAIALALNTVPSFVATTAVVVAFALREDVGSIEAVVVGALGAGAGRVILALAVRHGGDRFLRGAVRQNIAFVRAYAGRRRRITLSLALLAASPWNPAVAIFASAGAMRLRLAPIVIAYVLGRMALFGATVATAGAAARGIEQMLRRSVSPWMIGAGVALAVATFLLLARIDWRALVEDRRLRFVGADR